MKTLAGMIWGVVGGLFFACGVIVFTQLFGAGADILGFTEWTYRYYIVCLSICVALLICSKPARLYWRFMMGYLIAVLMVIGIGFQTFMDASSGQDQVAQMASNLLAMALIMAKVVMYLAPGALSAFYAFVAFDGVSKAPAGKNFN